MRGGGILRRGIGLQAALGDVDRRQPAQGAWRLHLRRLPRPARPPPRRAGLSHRLLLRTAALDGARGARSGRRLRRVGRRRAERPRAADGRACPMTPAGAEFMFDRRAETLSRDALAALQLERLRATLARAYDSLPHYRPLLDAA